MHRHAQARQALAGALQALEDLEGDAVCRKALGELLARLADTA